VKSGPVFGCRPREAERRTCRSPFLNTTREPDMMRSPVPLPESLPEGLTARVWDP